MTNKKTDTNHKLKQVIDLLKYSLFLEDQEIVKSTIESVIEILQELTK
jgi:hypothetical protein